MIGFTQVSCCKMIRTKNRVYKVDRRSSRVEARLNSGDSYNSTALKACTALGIGHNEKCFLLRMSGAIIPKI